MLEFTREDASAAAEQFLSGLARYSECFFGEGAAARLLNIEQDQVNPPFEFGQLGINDLPYADPAPFDKFEFPQVIETLYDFAAFGLCSSTEEIDNALSDGISFWEVFNHNGQFVDHMGAELVHPDVINIIDRIYKASEARAVILGTDLYAFNNIRLECLAALAGVSVKTLRNAASYSGANQLRTIKEGSSAVVSPEDALEWLRSRADFRETRIGSVPHLESYENVRQLGLHITTLCRYANLSIEELMNSVKFEADVSTGIKTLSDCSDSENLDALGAAEFYAIGKELDLPDPRQFAKEAIKVVASHNAARLAEEQLPA